MTAAITLNTQKYPFPPKPIPVLPPSRCAADIALPERSPERAELQSISIKTCPDYDQVAIVFREVSRMGAVNPPRYIELRGIGLELLTAYQLVAPSQITHFGVLNQTRSAVRLCEASPDGFGWSHVYMRFGWHSILSWKTRQLAVRVGPDLSEVSSDADPSSAD